MTSLKPYFVYRNPGVDWLGEVPAHWEIRRGGTLFTERNETSFPDLPILEVSLVTGVRIRDLADPNRKQMMSDRAGYKKAHEGDLPYNMMRMWQGAVGVAPVDGLVSPAYVVLRPRNGSVGYYYGRLFRTEAFMSEVKRHSRGIVSDRDRLYWEDFKQLHLPHPPLDEQRAIAAFLDAMDVRITRFIAARKKMIRLLEEKKQAVINQAVTKGLDPTVPMKDSGVDWLGELPAHWELRPNRSLFKQEKSLVGDSADEFTLLSLTLRGVIKRDMENPEGKFPAEFSTYQEVEPGDIVFCLFDIDETPRCVGLSKFSGMITGAYTVLRPIDSANAEYLYRYYLALDQRKALKPAYSGLRKVIPRARFMSIKTPLPPLEEQRAINQYLDREIGNIDSIIERSRREMELMQEYRTRLISDVVTGKLDVRGVDLGELPEFDEIPDTEATYDEEPESLFSSDALLVTELH